MRLAPSKKTPLFNGPLECRLFEIKMVAGSNRKVKKPAETPQPKQKAPNKTLTFRDVKDFEP